jgi:capsular exopolysaccharide synthesis family protein
MSDHLPGPASGRPAPRNGEPPLLPAPSYAPAPDPEIFDVGESSGLRDALQVLKRHLWIVILFPVVFTALGIYHVSQIIPQYRAQVSFRITDERSALMSGVVDAQGGLRRDPIPSQLAVLTGRSNLGEIVDGLGLRLILGADEEHRGIFRHVQVTLPDNESSTLRVRYGADGVRASMDGQEATAAYGQAIELPGVQFTVNRRPQSSESSVTVLPRENTIDRLRPMFSTSVRGNTDVIDMQVTSPSPALSQQIANTLVKTFQAANLEYTQEQATRRRIFLQEQIRSADSMLVVASQALIGARSRRETIGASEQLGARQTALIEMDARRGEMVAEQQVFRSMLEQLRATRSGERSRTIRTLMASPVVAANPAIMQLFSELRTQEAQLQALTAGEWSRSATHPDVQRLVALVTEAEEQLFDAISGHLNFLNTRLSMHDQQRSQLSAQLTSLPTESMEEWRLQLDVNRYSAMADQLRSQHQEASISEAVEAGQVVVINLARTAQPVSSRKIHRVALAVFLGIVLGCGSTFVLESLNTSIRRREELEDALRLPFLGVIPTLSDSPARKQVMRLGPIMFNRKGPRKALANGKGKALESAESAAPITVRDRRSNVAEAYRTVRTNLIFSQAVHSLKSILVTSPGKGEGKSTTASNLAVTFAQQGLRVVLIDADLRRPRIAKMFGVPREPGLTNLLLEANPREESICPTMVEGLFVMPSGTTPPNPAELLGGHRMHRLIKTLEEHYDMVIIDTPPVLVASDASILASRVDGVLIVVRAGTTERSEAQHAMNQIISVQGRILGAVLNDPDGKAVTYGGYNYYYKSDYYEAKEPAGV